MDYMIEAISALSADQGVAAAGHAPTALQHAADHFNELMSKEPDPTIYSEQHLAQGDTPATAFARAQEQMLRQTFDDVRAFSAAAPGMDMQTLAMRHIQLSYELSMVQVQFNAGVYVAQSGKTGLQTLMKNQ